MIKSLALSLANLPHIQTSLTRVDTKHTSLLSQSINYDLKSFIKSTPGSAKQPTVRMSTSLACTIKRFMVVINNAVDV